MTDAHDQQHNETTLPVNQVSSAPTCASAGSSGAVPTSSYPPRHLPRSRHDILLFERASSRRRSTRKFERLITLRPHMLRPYR